MSHWYIMELRYILSTAFDNLIEVLEQSFRLEMRVAWFISTQGRDVLREKRWYMTYIRTPVCTRMQERDQISSAEEDLLHHANNISKNVNNRRNKVYYKKYYRSSKIISSL